MAETDRPRASNLLQALGLGALVGIVLGVIVGVLVNPALGVVVGVAAGGGVAALSKPRSLTTQTSRSLDPFTISEPWRQYVQGANRSRRALASTVADVRDGPLKERLGDIARQLDGAVEQASRIAKRGNEIDAAVKRIDPTRLRSQLATLREQAADDRGDVQAAIASVESQLATSDRLKALSRSTADQLRLSQAQLDELVARAAEVGVGASDPNLYAHDVQDLNRELEALRLAVEETNRADDLAAGRASPSVSFEPAGETADGSVPEPGYQARTEPAAAETEPPETEPRGQTEPPTPGTSPAS